MIMYTLISDSSIINYIENLDNTPEKHICLVKNDNVDMMGYRDVTDGKDQLFFDVFINKDTSNFIVSRYDDLDCIRLDDGTILTF